MKKEIWIYLLELFIFDKCQILLSCNWNQCIKCQYAYRALFLDTVNTKYYEATCTFLNNEYYAVTASYIAIVVLGNG